MKSAFVFIAALSASACTTSTTSPGNRGETVPRHIKSPSYETRVVPRDPMKTMHVLETHDHCGNNCDFQKHAESSLMMHLTDDGAARAEDRGELHEQLSSTTGSSNAKTKWTRTWAGTWERDAETIKIVLKPNSISCKRRTDDGRVDEECGQRRELRLRCERVSLSLVRPKNRSSSAWACRARGFKPEETLTRLPWVFGVSEPLVVLDGGNTHTPERRYALTKPSRGGPPPKKTN